MTPRPEVIYKPVTGWRCDCTGDQIVGDPMQHHAVECPRRYQVTSMIPTEPDYHPRPRRTEDDQGHRDVIITPARPLMPFDPSPPPKALMLLNASLFGGVLTFAQAWRRHKVDGRSIDAVKNSVCLRIPAIGWACWTQWDGEEGWTTSGAMTVYQGRAYRSTHTQFARCVNSTKGQRDD